MTTGPVADVQSTGRPAKTPRLSKRDIVGIAMGIPLFLLSLCTLAVNPVGGGIVLFVSVSLLAPSRLYDHRKIRTMGFVALSLATAVAFCFGALSVIGSIELLSDPADEWEYMMLAVVYAVGGLIGFVLALSCTSILVFKVKPSLAQAAIAIAVGLPTGALMSYLLFYQA